ncbi:DUF4214 domain-containing protein [Pseudomonas sp. Marseille-QA0892]
MATVSVSQVQALYVGFLGRAADQAGLNFWLDAVRTDVSTLESVALGFTLSEEYQSLYGDLSTDELVSAIYQNVLGREPDAEGQAFWVNELNSGARTPDTLLAGMINSLGAIDQSTLDNKVIVANYYTQIAGDQYNAAAGAQIISGVTNNPQTVAAAIQSLEDGNLPGLVPGLGLYNTLVAAQSSLESFGTNLAETNPDLDADDDGNVTLAEANTALQDAIDARDNVSGETTTTLSLNVQNAEAAVANARTAVNGTQAGATALTNYESALAAQAALSDNDPAAEAAAQGGFNTAVSATGSTVSYASLDALAPSVSITDYASLYSALTSTTLVQSERDALVQSVSSVANFGQQVVNLANNDLAIARADAAVSQATTALQGVTAGQNYLNAVTARDTAADLLADAQEADAAVAGIQQIVDQYEALDTAVADAQAAFDNFAANNLGVTFQDITIGTTFTAVAGNDVFVFGSDVEASNDVAITGFGASGNDYIILGQGLTAGTTVGAGDNNVLEYFLTQGANGAQLVIETSNFGSSTLTVGANGTITASPDAAVITLTGVNVEDIQVNNGVLTVAA